VQPALAAALEAHARPGRLPRGAHVYRAGDEASAYLVVRSGIVRVQITADNGREIVLYRVGADEGCVLTTSCLLSHEPYAAEAVCETDVEALILPRAAFQALLDGDPAFRAFVLGSYASRVADLILLMEETAFEGIARRLARALLARAENGVVAATHQALAIEIGSAREVVSRHLKEFERRGLVRGHRGSVEIVDAAMLTQMAGDSA